MTFDEEGQRLKDVSVLFLCINMENDHRRGYNPLW